MSLTISSTVARPPLRSYRAIKDVILGAGYELSLSFIGAERARSLNKKTRGKTYVPNVLSFPLSATVGEIYLCPAVATREAVRYHLSPNGYLTYLFIHGCLHLKGHDHGDTMEKLEQHYVRQFSVS